MQSYGKQGNSPFEIALCFSSLFTGFDDRLLGPSPERQKGTGVTLMARYRKLIGKQRLIERVRARMHGTGVGMSCDGCGLKDVAQRERVGESSNWIPVVNNECSSDCEKKLVKLLAHLSGEYDVIFSR